MKRLDMFRKKMLSDTHCITKEDGTQVAKSIIQWINTEPLTIWNDMYSKGGSKRLTMSSHAYELLRDKIKKDYPEVYTKSGK
jgi:hypothetical protein